MYKNKNKFVTPDRVDPDLQRSPDPVGMDDDLS